MILGGFSSPCFSFRMCSRLLVCSWLAFCRWPCSRLACFPHSPFCLCSMSSAHGRVSLWHFPSAVVARSCFLFSVVFFASSVFDCLPWSLCSSVSLFCCCCCGRCCFLLLWRLRRRFFFVGSLCGMIRLRLHFSLLFSVSQLRADYRSVSVRVFSWPAA